MKIGHLLGILSAVLTAAAAAAAPLAVDADGSVRARLDRAKTARVAARAGLSPAERDILWLLDFETPDVMLARDGGWIPVELEKSHFVPGRFGRGYHFELPRANYLPPAVADAETDLSGFAKEGNARLESVPADTSFGRRALSVSCAGPGDGFSTVPVKAAILRSGAGHMPTVTLLASCYVKGPAGARVRLSLRLVPEELTDPKTKAPVADRKPDAAEPREVALTGGWQRVACTATGDRRLPERTASLEVVFIGGAAARLLVDGLQFESCAYYPHHRMEPTTWTPGGTEAPATGLSFTDPSMLRAFPHRSGTVAFWTLTPPADSNLKGPGSIAWFAFLRGYRDPHWSLNAYSIAAGPPVNAEGKPVPVYSGRGLGPAADGRWHHLAMTWEGKTAVVYLDGSPAITFLREDPDIRALVGTYSLQIGCGRGQSANSVLDDFAVFGRALAPEEIAGLAGGTAPLRTSAQPAVLAAGPRGLFYRDETAARIEIPVAGAPKDGPAVVDCSVGGLLAGSARVALARGRAVAVFDLVPAALRAGEQTVRAAVSVDDAPVAYREFPVTVAPPLRADTFLMSTWNGGLADDHLAYYRELGLNGINTWTTDPAAIERLGALGFRYDWHYRGGEEPARTIARRIAALPNWRRTLINSETGEGRIPDEKARAEWFDAYVRKEFGAPVPAADGWRFGGPHNHTMCFFPADRQPGPDGVYPVAPESYRFLEWWEEGGGTAWLKNFQAARAVKAVRPDVVTWTDPVQSKGQYRELDAGGSWAYSTDLSAIWNSLQQGCNVMRAAGKPYEATLGLNYVSVETTEPDGVKKNLAPTPDDAVGQAWVAAGLVPSDALYYWDVGGYFDGERGQNGRYAVPGSTRALGRVLREEIGPLGTMLGGVGNSPRPMALLLPRSTLWFVAGEGKWNWGATHYPSMWKRELANSGIPYDIVTDYGATRENLSRYKVIFFPAALYVREDVRSGLLAAAAAGTRIVVDSYCRQEYPGMTRLSTKYEYWWRLSKEKQEAYFAEIRGLLAGLRDALRPAMPAFASGSEGPVLVGAREADGVRYVVLVNDNRQPGQYTEWAKRPDWRPYGKAQRAAVSIAAPAGGVVYEFVASKRLPAVVKDGRLTVDVELPAAGGRVLCVHPAPFGRLEVTGDAGFVRGTAGSFGLLLTDGAGAPVPGRQLVDVRITGPDGKEHDESGFYRLERGKAAIPFRPALQDAAGGYRVAVTERCSGLKATGVLTVR